MAKHIPADQARKLASQYRDLIGRVSMLLDMVAACRQEEARAYQALVSSSAYQDSFRLALQLGRSLDDSTPELERFTIAFNQSNACTRPERYLVQARDYLSHDCAKQLDLLAEAPTGLARIATLPSKLASIDQAFEALRGYYDAVLEDIYVAESDIRAILTPSNDDPHLRTPCNVRGAMRSAEGLLNTMGSIPTREVEDVVAQWEHMQAVRSQADALAEKAANDAKRAVEAYRIQQAREALSQQPVEMLSQLKRNVRVKALRDNGYTSLGDIYSAGPAYLEVIRGISPETAQVIYDFSCKQLDMLRDSTRLSLSYDDRDLATTRIVSSLWKCRSSRAISRVVAEALTGGDPFAFLSTQSLDPLRDFARWPFVTERDRRDSLRAYRQLSNIVHGEARTRCANAARQLSLFEAYSADDAWGDFRENPIEYSTLLEELVPGCLGNNDAYYGLPEELAQQIEAEDYFPDGLLCKLRRYQEWGVKYILHQERVLLGDEMGLGKTIQAIATMVSLRNIGQTHFLVVCPASVTMNWCREVEKHSRLKAIKIHGSTRRTSLSRWVETGGVAVTTYETVSSIQFPDTAGLVVVDEAHYVKNPEAARSKAVAQLCAGAKRVLLMTGTPIENNVDEMIRLVGLLRPSLVPELAWLAQMGSVAAFRNKLITVYYRRKRQDVLTELPKLIEKIEWCTMTTEDKAVYRDAALKSDRGNPHLMRRVSWNVSDLSKSSKAQRLLTLAEEARQDGRKVLVFSFYRETIKAVRRLLGSRCTEAITGSVPAPERQRIIDDFDSAAPGSVLVAQIQAGGTGLNIQSASVVVICEPQCKPSIENQAISRAYRMGQARNVLVYRLLCADSIDQRFQEILDEKQQTFDTYADKSVAAAKSAELDEKTVGNIIEEEIERLKAEQEDGESQGVSEEE